MRPSFCEAASFGPIRRSGNRLLPSTAPFSSPGEDDRCDLQMIVRELTIRHLAGAWT